MPKEWKMTNTELRLKRERMLIAFKAGHDALKELKLPYFLAYGSALACLREGQFMPHEDNVNVGIFSWDLAGVQRRQSDPSPCERDGAMLSVFEKHGFEAVAEMMDQRGAEDEALPTANACPRLFVAEGWTEEDAYPILYKFTHKDSFISFFIIGFTMQFGLLWDFADGGAETSAGWKYKPFSPQPVEFHKTMTHVMPADALTEHYGPDWHLTQSAGYIQGLAKCLNRCQVLRVHPWDSQAQPKALPDAVPWEDFRKQLNQYRLTYAKSTVNAESEVAPKELDLFKIESKPMILFQAAGICKLEGNELLKSGSASKALQKYDEGIYIMEKCHQTLLQWRLTFRQIHNEKSEKDRKERGMKLSDLAEPEMPAEFRTDELEELKFRTVLLLNAAQAALQIEDWATAEARAGKALELDPGNQKALYRRGVARMRAGRGDSAKADFLALIKVSNFESKEAIAQLMKLMTKEEAEQELRALKSKIRRGQELGQLVVGQKADERVALQEDRYARYLADCEQRRMDKAKEISFDEWAKQYEWRYDAEQRVDVRKKWPEFFNHMGPAPLPVEEWEVDYLTHKEIDKIVYNRETQAMGARRLQRDGPRPSALPASEGYQCKLELDKEDEAALKDTVVRKGYNYWW